MAVLLGADACSKEATGRRRLMAAATLKPVMAPNPDPSSTSLQIELAFNEKINKIVGTKVSGSYSHLVHDHEYTSSCTSQVTDVTSDKALIEPQPQWRKTWMPELLYTVQLGVRSSSVCAEPVLSSAQDDFFYSRLDVGVMNAEGSEVHFNKGSCTVALSMMYKGHGCVCHCFEGQAVVDLGEDKASGRQVVTCSGLHRDPALGCSCSMCPVAAA